VADLLTAWRPDEPTDPVLLRYTWTHRWEGWFHERHAVVAGGRAVGYVACYHPPWEREPQRYGRFEVKLLPGQLELAPDLLRALERRLREERAKLLRTECYEDEAWLRRELERHGYGATRGERASELDLRRHRERLLELTAESRARVAEIVRIVTMAEVGEIWGPLTDLFNQTARDVPTTIPILPDSEAEVREQMQAPSVRPDRVWLAMVGGRPVAASFLAYPPVRGHVWTDYTCCARSHRGRGIGRAVKMETIAQAVELGVARLRTLNDPENRPIIHINETLGYEPIPGPVEYLKQALRPG
jgi:RimJ/RimL family protein N-acetyltransferase